MCLKLIHILSVHFLQFYVMIAYVLVRPNLLCVTDEKLDISYWKKNIFYYFGAPHFFIWLNKKYISI